MLRYLVPLLFFLTLQPSVWAAAQDEFSPGVSTIDNAEIRKAVAYFEYSPEVQYTFNVQPGYVTDLQLCAGDTISNVIAGDTDRWMIYTATVGEFPHVYVKPIEDQISTNIIVNTNYRVYRLVVHAAGDYVPAVVWTDVGEYQARMAAAREKAEKEQLRKKEPLAAFYYNYNYQVKSKKKGWIPKVIYDDGVRTFIAIPPDAKNDLPVIHIADDKKKKADSLALVNYRVKDGWYVVDRVFQKAVLSFSQERSITIENMKGAEK